MEGNFLPSGSSVREFDKMEAIIVRAINGDKIGALFVENQEIYLADIRRQMMEEIDEFLPEKFHFMSVWEVPISSVQEKKITLKHALHPDGCLIIKPDQVEETGKRTLNEDEGESVLRQQAWVYAKAIAYIQVIQRLLRKKRKYSLP